MNNKKKTVLWIIAMLAIFIALSFFIFSFLNFYFGRNKGYNLDDINIELIDYLKEKYPESEFRIIELTGVKNQKTSGFQIDGTYLVKSSDIKGKEIYTYDLESKLDNVEFTANVYVEYDKIASVYETYGIIKKFETIEEYIKKSNVLGTINKTETKIEVIDKNINIYINDSFDSLINEKSIKDITDIHEYIKNYNKEVFDTITYLINVYDNTGKIMRFYYNYSYTKPQYNKDYIGLFDANGKYICELSEYNAK